MKAELRQTAPFAIRLQLSLVTVLSSPYVLIAPCLLLFLVFMAYPVFFALYVSLHRWTGVGPIGDFVGILNYAVLAQDWVFRAAVVNTFKLAVGAIVLQVGGAIVLGVLIYSVRRGRLLLRTLFFIPCTMSLIAVGLLWNWIYHPQFGLLNAVLGSAHLDFLKMVWLGDERLALAAVVVANSWQWTGLYLLFILAGLQNIDPSLYELADIEGARWHQRLRYVTLPLINTQIYISMMLCLVFTLRLMPFVYALTMGGPGHATDIMGLTIYRYAFRFQRMDSAAAMSFLLLIVIYVASITFGRMLKKDEV